MKFVKINILMLVSVFLLTANAMATPTLYDITSINGTQNYTDTGDQGFMLTDTDGTSDDATAFLLLELAGFADRNTFGIYGYNYDTNGNVQLGNTLEIFAGSDAQITSATLHFDLETNTVTNQSTNLSAGIEADSFGFYITTPEHDGYTYFTHTELNSDGVDHTATYDTSDNSVGSLLGSDFVIAFEDLYGGGDQDFNDLVVGITDIQAAPVPEPGTMLLLGSGLLGIAGIRRRKK